MSDPAEQDMKHALPRKMNEFAGSLASNLTWAVGSWSKDMSHLLSENARLSAELQDLKERTASVASERAVRDRQNVEDITDPNRPTQIGQLYTQFIDGDRMDAVDALQKEFPDKHYANHRLVCEIFEVAFEVATVAITSVREHIPRTLVNPTSLRTPSVKSQQKQQAGEEPIEVYFKYTTTPELEKRRRDADIKNITDSISAYLRRTSRSVDITAMKEDVLSDIEKRYPPEKRSLLFKKLRLVQNFISDCCKLAWQLVVQTPSMHIQYNDRTFDKMKHEQSNKQSSTSKSATSTRIRHYLWPTLLYNLNGKVACKGIVVTGDSEV
ncbi:uncharacterized protein LOC118424872 [Branchiostoma floridae]|uniref:Mitochondria-eating protein n=1 Tax=Branchiostoma floridae TaxID=7739 RepID=A0A9J7LY26_BRAFL|nr:uncharacterized protein LOC118424872 [Branchiostoma floridae]